MKKVNKKQRLQDFIASRPRGVIVRLAEYVGVSPVSVHSWLDDEKGWMTRNNEKKVEEFIKQEQEADQPLPAEQEATPPQVQPIIENYTRDMLAVIQRYAPHIQSAGVVKEKDIEQRELSKPARSANTPYRSRGEDRRTTNRRAIARRQSKINPATTKAPAKDD